MGLSLMLATADAKAEDDLGPACRAWVKVEKVWDIHATY